jgi:hypothetical protein
MTKRDFTLLEKIFAVEIEGHLPYHSRSKEYLRLEKEGMVERETITFRGGRFPVTVSGWALTHRGRMDYCLECSKIDEKDLVR